MFLWNMFKGGSGYAEEEKFDRIHFKINLNDHVPRFEEWNEQQWEDEEPLTPSHPLYSSIFPHQEDGRYVEYKTTENDTLFGLAIKLEISEKSIRELNSLSGNIYPGMTIRLPEGTDLGRLIEAPQQPSQKPRISQLLQQPEKNADFVSIKFRVSYYAGKVGYIKGTLIVNPSYLIFNPDLENETNLEKFTVERLLKFNAIVETEDIQDICCMELPQMTDSEVPSTLSVVQFMLYRVGNPKIQTKFKERLRQLKLDHKAIASMSFSIDASEEASATELAKELSQKVRELLPEQGTEAETEQEKSHLTNIPFFDIIQDNIQPKQAPEKQQLDKIIKKNSILGGMLEPSQILSADEFVGVVKAMPVLYQLYNWTRVYNSTKDGSSFTTLLNRCQGVEPAILLIKEYKGYRFGAFLIQNLQPGKTGRGEMFIFSYKEENSEPEIHHWTGKNQTFVVCERTNGVGIGIGFKYGIFLKNDLDKGSTAPTKTFGNEAPLSKKEDFLVEEVQVWGVDSSF